MILEICTDTLASSIIAEKAGADRIELCADLCVGGTTPSAGLVRQVKSRLNCPIVMMIRPRSGDFCYTQEEIETMKADILFAKESGIEGVIFGVLTPDGEIDTTVMSELIKLSRPMEVVCHRAFDMTKDALKSLETLISLGVDRLLSSGFSNSAPDGIETLRELRIHSNNRLTIMPGGGVNKNNIHDLILKSGANEFHLSGKTALESRMIFRKEGISMGSASANDEYALDQADYAIIAEVKTLLK